MTFDTRDCGNSSKGRKYMGLAKQFSFNTWFGNRDDLSRGEICALNWLRSGHVRSRAHLAPKGFRVEEMCTCGDDVHSLNTGLF